MSDYDAEELFRRLAALRNSVVMTPEEWTPERALDIVREQRRREAVEGRTDAHMDGHARAIAHALADVGVAPDDLSTTLLAMASHLGTVLAAHARPADSMVMRLLWVVADEIDRAQHQPDIYPTRERRCGRCGGLWPCSIATGGR
jgi:membrane glycosyltransferase